MLDNVVAFATDKELDNFVEPETNNVFDNVVVLPFTVKLPVITAFLATARNIGGVSFDGSANIDLPGVNSSGNQDTSGNAATATALETARTIAGQSFDGTAIITIASTDLSNTSAITLLTSTQTLTNKTIDLGNNTLTGTTAEFNTAYKEIVLFL